MKQCFTVDRQPHPRRENQPRESPSNPERLIQLRRRLAANRATLSWIECAHPHGRRPPPESAGPRPPPTTHVNVTFCMILSTFRVTLGRAPSVEPETISRYKARRNACCNKDIPAVLGVHEVQLGTSNLALAHGETISRSAFFKRRASIAEQVHRNGSVLAPGGVGPAIRTLAARVAIWRPIPSRYRTSGICKEAVQLCRGMAHGHDHSLAPILD